MLADEVQFLWGRGASDDTNMLLAELEAATLLLEGGFVPRRTVLFAFGFDEESKGLEGAGHIAPYLESIYGKDGIALIVDEGGLGLGEMFGAGFASPSTGEKGYLDVRFTLDTPGGHSSVPPVGLYNIPASDADEITGPHRHRHALCARHRTRGAPLCALHLN